MVDWIDGKVYVYQASGQRDSASDFALDSANGSASGITFANNRFYVVNTSPKKVYAYDTAGQREPAADVGLHADNALAAGITFANDRFFVVDSSDDRVNAYSAGAAPGTTPSQMTSADFDLANHHSPSGIAFANNRLFVIDDWDDRVYAYTASGQRDSAADFDLDSDNDDPEAITFANSRFFVVDNVDDKVYAYQASGQRDAAADFDLDSDNNFPFPEGITFANGRFFVVDNADDKVYAYQSSGQRDSAADFDLDSDNDDPEAITFANNRFYVVDAHLSNWVYAYDASGQRDSASDFYLVDSANDDPTGITFADGRIYVVDWRDDKVYVINSTALSPDLVISSVSASGTSRLLTGQSFELRATVRNRGSAGSTATTLRCYRSNDSTISTRDTQVCTDVAVAALSRRTSSSATITLTAPAAGGTYYYAVCVEPVSGEPYTDNNCSSSVEVRVRAIVPDLVVESTSVSSSALATGQSFELQATVRNRGIKASAATTLRYYRSANRSITTSDLQVGTDAVSALAVRGSSSQTITLTAPAAAGTYYYGACVDQVAEEAIGSNNCSRSQLVRVRVRGPDLVVESPSVSDDTPASGGSFEFTTSVRNRGIDASAATTLRYYRSTNSLITTSDLQVGTDAVSALAANGASSQTITFPAPTAAGTYYYGACVDQVAEEADTGNNCSTAVVVFGGGPFPAYDLEISSATLHAPVVASPGTPISMSVTVANQGPNRSQPAKLQFRQVVSSTYRDIPALDSGATTTFSDVPVGYVLFGRLTFRACIVEAPGEEDTSNNCISRSVTYSPRP